MTTDFFTVNQPLVLFLSGRAFGPRPFRVLAFSYVSANTDLLGWTIERATGEGIAEFLSSRLWKPIGAEDDASITLDRTGLARASGGLGATARDFARIGRLMIDDGRRDTREIVPKSVIDDVTCSGDAHAWRTGEWGS